MFTRLLLIVLSLSVVTIPAASACSVAPGYRIPTTLELVDEADAIILARVEDGEPVSPRAADNGLRLAPLLLLKGSELPAVLTMRGWIEAGSAKATRSDPGELERANPDAFDGACNRYVFAPGMTLLLFLKRDGEGWTPISHAFARTAEDVRSFDARWVKAVREYVAIAALPPEMRPARLIARQDALRARGDTDSLAIAADIERELAGPRKPLREALPPVR